MFHSSLYLLHQQRAPQQVPGELSKVIHSSSGRVSLNMLSLSLLSKSHQKYQLFGVWPVEVGGRANTARSWTQGAALPFLPGHLAIRLEQRAAC